jgi:orotidine-5'-phosphate decarboxylase
MTSPASPELTTARSRLAFALDYANLSEARAGAEGLRGAVGVLKVGLELFVREGHAAVHMARDLDCDVFLDLKLHDISKTVERAVANACQLGVKYLTIHASGGPGMLEAAAKAALTENTGLCVLGVTVLTSLDQSDLEAVGVTATPAEQAERLALLAKRSGLGGLVCSSAEVARLRAAVGPDMVLVTPGIRPSGADVGDQKRVGTPAEAIRQGSTLLVVGRPIRDAADPRAAAESIVREIASAV